MDLMFVIWTTAFFSKKITQTLRYVVRKIIYMLKEYDARSIHIPVAFHLSMNILIVWLILPVSVFVNKISQKICEDLS